MYTAKRQPGKFEGNSSQLLARVVNNITMDGTCEQLGDVQGFGFYSFVEGKRFGFIVSEDNYGFVVVEYWPLAEARQQWANLELSYEVYCKQTAEFE